MAKEVVEGFREPGRVWRELGGDDGRAFVDVDVAAVSIVHRVEEAIEEAKSAHEMALTVAAGVLVDPADVGDIERLPVEDA